MLDYAKQLGYRSVIFNLVFSENLIAQLINKFVKRWNASERILDALLRAQAQVAERMGTQAPAVARLERALATGRHSPSVATLRKYVKACGKRLVLRVA